VIEASGSSTRSSTCETPSVPHVNPPSGHAPRTNSTAVQAAATAATVRHRWDGRVTPTARTANSAMNAADNSVSDVHAMTPKRKIQ
jgi:hypothetical protein